MRAVIFLAVFLLSGCGYKSAAHYARSVVGERISTEVVTSMEDPQNTVLIKDAVDMAVITKFRSSLVPKSESQTHLKIAIASVTFTPLRYDTNGYVIAYRTTVSLHIDRFSKEGKNFGYDTRGLYDFVIEANAIITDQARFEAIRQGAAKGIDAFIARVAAEGANMQREE